MIRALIVRIMAQVSDEPAQRHQDKTVILYDGECPFCVSYVRFARLRDALGKIELLDARGHPEMVENYAARGFPIDDGMIVDTGEEVYFGGDAVWAINALVGRNPLLRLMSGRAFLRFVYPVLRGGRNLVTRLRGKPPIQPET